RSEKPVIGGAYVLVVALPPESGSGTPTALSRLLAGTGKDARARASRRPVRYRHGTAGRVVAARPRPLTATRGAEQPCPIRMSRRSVTASPKSAAAAPLHKSSLPRRPLCR